MSALAARRANFFRGTRQFAGDVAPEAAVPRVQDIAGSGTIAEREKSELVERHLAALEATLPPMSLSQADRDVIRARAMLGPSNASAILVSVMQAVAAVRPPLQQHAVNYYSSATGADAKQAEGLIAAGGRGGDAAYRRGIQARELRERASVGDGIAGLSRISTSSFGLDGNGSLSGMSTQLYRQHFQSYYGASPQGQFTATRVAGILGRNEGLSGEALVARTKEVARDTRDRLGLDTNVYAPKVANIGKKYSDQIIANKANLDQAREAHKRGDTAAAEQHERRFLDERKRQEERARREDPSKLGDVAGVYNGLIVEAMRNGWVPSDKNAGEVFRSVIQSRDPEARKRVDEMLAAAKQSPGGATMVEKLKPIINEEQKAAAARAISETRAAEVDKKVAGVATDIDSLAGPEVGADKEQTAPAPAGQNDKQQAASAPAADKKATAAAPAKKPGAPAAAS